MIPHSNKARQFIQLALAVSGVLFATGPMSAQTIEGTTVFTVPDEICTWDWTGPVTPWLLAELKSQNLLVLASVYLAKNCPDKLCDIQWQGYSVPEDFQEHAFLPDEMLCELSHRQLFFEDVIQAVTAVCPDVAQVMSERVPEVYYEACGPWPRVEPPDDRGSAAPIDDVLDDFADDFSDDFDTAPN